VACIILEMSRKTPMFPGTDPLDKLFKIFRLLGTPVMSETDKNPCAETYWPELSDTKKFGNMSETFPQWYPHSWELIADKLPSTGQDLISGMLCYNPRLRLSAEESLNSKYLREDITILPEVSTPCNPSDCSDTHQPVESEDISVGSGNHVFMNGRSKRKYSLNSADVTPISVNDELVQEGSVKSSLGTFMTGTTDSSACKSHSQSRPKMLRSVATKSKPSACRRSKKY